MTTTKFRQKHADRLLKLAEFLDQVPERQFDLGRFATLEECGFVGCAIGWAGKIPEFRRLGFRTDHDAYGYLDITYKDLTTFDAAQEFFGLEEQEVEYMFLTPDHSPDDFGIIRPSPYRHNRPKAKTVARAIRAFVAKKGASNAN